MDTLNPGDAPNRRPSQRDRKSRYQSDDDSDSYQPRGPRDGASRNSRSDRPDGPGGRPRRRSILVDPNDNEPRRRRRGNSKVRFPSSSDSDSDGPRDRRGAGRTRGPGLSRHDAERKDGQEHRQFRERRDGYLSDEGEAHKKAMLRPGRRDPSNDDEGPGPRRKNGPSGAGLLSPNAALPGRERPRASSAIPPPQSGPREDEGDSRRPNYDTEPERLERRRTYKDPERSERDRRRPAQYDDDGSPPRRDGRRRPASGYSGDERGYRSDRAPRRNDDDRDYGRSRRDDGYRSDHGPRSTRPRAQDDYYRDDRDRPRRDRYDDDRRHGEGRRDRHGDSRRSRDYDDDRARSGRGSNSRGSGRGGAAWQKEASELFMTYALPYIRKEGPRMAQKYLAGRRSNQ